MALTRWLRIVGDSNNGPMTVTYIIHSVPLKATLSHGMNMLTQRGVPDPSKRATKAALPLGLSKDNVVDPKVTCPLNRPTIAMRVPAPLTAMSATSPKESWPVLAALEQDAGGVERDQRGARGSVRM